MTRIAVPLRMTYAEYIASAAWGDRRRMRLEKDGHRCQGCGSEDDLHVHHRTYERLGNELLDDQVTACEICHIFIHQEQARTRRPLDVATDTALALIRASGPVQQVPRDRVPHIPRHVREPSDWRKDSRNGGTWLRRVPQRKKGAASRRGEDQAPRRDQRRSPSPDEIEAARTPAGGWTRKQLAAWGVPWPPPKGWRRALIERYEQQQTSDG